jgi:hypothetical protein
LARTAIAKRCPQSGIAPHQAVQGIPDGLIGSQTGHAPEQNRLKQIPKDDYAAADSVELSARIDESFGASPAIRIR